MTLGELMALSRYRIRDNNRPYIVDDAVLVHWLNEAQNQACIRGRLLVEDKNIDLCQIYLQPDEQTYPLHYALYEIISLRIYHQGCSQARQLQLVTREWLDAERPGWRDDCRTPAEFAIQDELTLRIVGAIGAGDVLRLECYRLPLYEMLKDSDTTEIHRAHHDNLMDWVVYRAGGVQGTEVGADEAVEAERAFSRYFGLQPDSDMRRATRHDVQHYIRAILP